MTKYDMTKEERETIVAEYLKTDEGKKTWRHVLKKEFGRVAKDPRFSESTRILAGIMAIV